MEASNITPDMSETLELKGIDQDPGSQKSIGVPAIVKVQEEDNRPRDAQLAFPRHHQHAEVSLTQRAPTGSSLVWTKRLYLNLKIGVLERILVVEENGCQRIKKKSAHVRFRLRKKTQTEEKPPTPNFFYPTSWKNAVKNTDARGKAFVEELARREPNDNMPEAERRDNDVVQNANIQQTMRGDDDVERGGTTQQDSSLVLGGEEKVVFGLYRFMGYSTRLHVDRRAKQQPMYLVIGIFSDGHPTPKEAVVFVDTPGKFFRALRWGIIRLRGFWSSAFSLRRVKGFQLYKCNTADGSHEKVTLDQYGSLDLQRLHYTYRDVFTHEHIQNAWARWLHLTLNNDSYNVMEGNYSLQIVLGWSLTRIATVLIVPVLLSLCTGLGINAWQGWKDGGAIQTAWGAASYVVTAGALLAVLLGVLGNIGY